MKGAHWHCRAKKRAYCLGSCSRAKKANARLLRGNQSTFLLGPIIRNRAVAKKHQDIDAGLEPAAERRLDDFGRQKREAHDPRYI